MGRELSPADAARPQEAGFTLIELMVVVAIVATLALGVALSAGRVGQGGEGDLARFRSGFALNRALAIEGREMRGLNLGPKGMQVMVWRLAAEGGGWQPLGAPLPWRGRVAFAARRPGGGDAPDLVFLPNGRSTGFSIRFDGDDSGRCESDGWAGLTCG